jgi:hypothetical protein
LDGQRGFLRVLFPGTVERAGCQGDERGEEERCDREFQGELAFVGPLVAASPGRSEIVQVYTQFRLMDQLKTALFPD